MKQEVVGKGGNGDDEEVEEQAGRGKTATGLLMKGQFERAQ